MQSAIRTKFQPLLLHPLFPIPIGESVLPVTRITFVTISRVSDSFTSIFRKTRFQVSPVCARRKRRRYISTRARKLGLRILAFFIYNLKAVPQPLVLVIAPLVGGDSGGLGYRTGFGGTGGFQNRRKRSGLPWAQVVLGLCTWYTVSKGRLDTLAGLSILAIGLFCVPLVDNRNNAVRNLIYGLCCFVVLMSFGMKRQNAGSWAATIRSLHSLARIVKK